MLGIPTEGPNPTINRSHRWWKANQDFITPDNEREIHSPEFLECKVLYERWYELVNTFSSFDGASAEYKAAQVFNDKLRDEYAASLGRLLALPASPVIEVAAIARLKM